MRRLGIETGADLRDKTRAFLDDLGLVSLEQLPPLEDMEKVMDLADAA